MVLISIRRESFLQLASKLKTYDQRFITKRQKSRAELRYGGSHIVITDHNENKMFWRFRFNKTLKVAMRQYAANCLFDEAVTNNAKYFIKNLQHNALCSRQQFPCFCFGAVTFETWALEL